MELIPRKYKNQIGFRIFPLSLPSTHLSFSNEHVLCLRRALKAEENTAVDQTAPLPITTTL